MNNLSRKKNQKSETKRLLLFRIDSWFARINQALGRDRIPTADGKEDIRYAVRKINQYFSAGIFYRLTMAKKVE